MEFLYWFFTETELGLWVFVILIALVFGGGTGGYFGGGSGNEDGGCGDGGD